MFSKLLESFLVDGIAVTLLKIALESTVLLNDLENTFGLGKCSFCVLVVNRLRLLKKDKEDKILWASSF